MKKDCLGFQDPKLSRRAKRRLMRRACELQLELFALEKELIEIAYTLSKDELLSLQSVYRRFQTLRQGDSKLFRCVHYSEKGLGSKEYSSGIDREGHCIEDLPDILDLL